MALAEDLKDQAYVLATLEPRKPKQASLRRAVSTAYYALFHLLLDDGMRLVAPPGPEGLRTIARRASEAGRRYSIRISGSPTTNLLLW